MGETKSTCPYCGTGCGVIIQHDGGRISGVRGDPDHPANFGQLCSKGMTLHLTTDDRARALFPELRHDRAGTRQRATWDQALEFVAGKFARSIEEHGPDSVAFYISGQLLTEDYYVFNKLAKGLIGTNNIDTNSRLCMSSAVAGYKATLGADAPPCCYQDIDHADCMLIAGSNAAYAHPILFRRIEAAKAARPELKIIVIDPRRTDTAELADLFLPILPGTDVALFNAMLHVLIAEGYIDQVYVAVHTEGFAALAKTVEDYPPSRAAQICGVPKEDIVRAAHYFGQAHAALSLYCQGLNQSIHGTEKNAALIHLHLATGQIGKPGAGPFSLTGQPNAMGGREVGGMANLLSAHRDLANPAHRAEVAQLWGIDAVPAKPGKTAVEMFQALHAGEIKVIWIACTNPAQSMPDQEFVRAALQKAELVVLQECARDTDTAAYADVVLPATTWGEKQGTVTNSERRISRVNSAVPAPGEARDDWRIAADFALRLGRKLHKAHANRLFPYAAPEDIFNEHRESTRGRDLDITGLTYAKLERDGPQYWPFRERRTEGTARLYCDGIFPTANGRAFFLNVVFRPTAEGVQDAYPLRLTNGRMRDQWHSMTRTGLVAQLCNHAEEPVLDMHADDMAQRGLNDGDIARVASRRGALCVRVCASTGLQPGQAFLPMHWGSRYMRGAGSNTLTLSNFDATSKQPEFKHAAVQVAKLDVRWRLAAMLATENAVDLLRDLQPLLTRFDYASINCSGRDTPVVVLRAYACAEPEAQLLGAVDAAFGFSAFDCMASYDDPARAVSKRAFGRGGNLAGVRLAGETRAADWLKELLARGSTPEELWNWLLAPLAEPPHSQIKRGRTVCTCHDVAERDILELLYSGAPLAQVQETLKCGTGCGSCVPELRRMERELALPLVA